MSVMIVLWINHLPSSLTLMPDSKMGCRLSCCILIALSSSLIGSFAYSYLSLPAEVSQLNPYVRSFARALFSDAGRLFLIQGLVLLALSVIAFGVDRFIRKPTATEPAQSNQPTKPEEEQPGHKSEPAEPADTEK